MQNVYKLLTAASEFLENELLKKGIRSEEQIQDMKRLTQYIMDDCVRARYQRELEQRGSSDAVPIITSPSAVASPTAKAAVASESSSVFDTQLSSYSTTDTSSVYNSETASIETTKTPPSSSSSSQTTSAAVVSNANSGNQNDISNGNDFNPWIQSVVRM